MNATREAMDDIRRILASREALYARADAVVDTAARSVRQSLKDLERAVPTTVRDAPAQGKRSQGRKDMNATDRAAAVQQTGRARAGELRHPARPLPATGH